MRRAAVIALFALLAGCTPPPQMPSDEQAVVQKLDNFSDAYDQTQNGIQQDAIAASQEKFLKANVLKRHVHNWIGTLESIDTMFDTVFVKIDLSDDVTVEQQIDQKSSFVKKLAPLTVGSTVRFSGRFTQEGSITSSGRTENPELYIKLDAISQM